ncbi:sugar phosphate isomerase/epimerase [Opitutaceae bacterium EW11]|nr:sugar phosphate isomerase/epimerase [Opitutaceae bacterium EW11]
MSRTPVALQLYSVRDDTARDFARTVAEVASIGYTGVELAGYGSLDARGANKALRDAGLAVAAMHILRDALRKDFDRVVEEAQLLSCPHIVCPWLAPEEYVSRGAVEDIGREFDEIGERLRKRGLAFSFHNHAAEFRCLEGRPIMAWMLDAAAPRNVGAELDVYWAHVAGYAPERFLREQGQRVDLLHLKDEKVIGGGPVNFGPIFATAEAIGAVEWYIVEQENYDDTPLASVRKCFEQLRKWSKA